MVSVKKNHLTILSEKNPLNCRWCNQYWLQVLTSSAGSNDHTLSYFIEAHHVCVLYLCPETAASVSLISLCSWVFTPLPIHLGLTHPTLFPLHTLITSIFIILLLLLSMISSEWKKVFHGTAAMLYQSAKHTNFLVILEKACGYSKLISWRMNCIHTSFYLFFN